MNFENVKGFLAIWGAGLSTMLAALTIVRFRRESKVKLILFAFIEAPHEEIRLEICNKYKKPTTIHQIIVSIGNSVQNSTTILNHSFESPIKLQESDMHFEKFERSKILEAIQNINIQQQEFQRIWVTIKLSTGRKFTEPVYIHPSIISNKFYKKAEQFIATDLFLGFTQMDSNAYLISPHK